MSEHVDVVRVTGGIFHMRSKDTKLSQDGRDTNAECAVELYAAADELERLEADKARLDWLDADAIGSPSPLKSTLDTWWEHVEGMTVREAIDTARNAQPEEKSDEG